MSNRYSWLEGPYNDADFRDGAVFEVLDKKTGMIYKTGFYIRDRSSALATSTFYYAGLENQEFWDFVCATSPDACYHLPRCFQNPDLLLDVATNTSNKFNLQTMDLELAEEMGGYDKVYNICKEMVKRFEVAISYVPRKYLTNELVDMAIEMYPNTLSRLPVDERSKQRCIKAVMKNAKALRSVPHDKKSLIVNFAGENKKLYEVAVEKDGMALSFVPASNRNFALCYKALSLDSRAIQFVPASVITYDFLEKLSDNGIFIDDKFLPYVKECLKVNGRGSHKDSVIDEEDISISDIDDDNSIFSDILLSDLANLIPNSTLKLLEKRGITTLEQLFVSYENRDLGILFSESRYLEINGLVNVLSCKFKGRDPKIDFNNSSVEYIIGKLGFPPTVARQVLLYGKVTIGELIEQAKLPFDKQVWSFPMNGVSDFSKRLCVDKLLIVADYYDKKVSNDESTISHIDGLQAQLLELNRQSAILDNKIKTVIDEIESLSKQGQDSVGGISYIKK